MGNRLIENISHKVNGEIFKGVTCQRGISRYCPGRAGKR